MKRACVLSTCLLLAVSSVTFARGILVPKDKSLPPLAIKSHRVSVTVDSQVAVTKVVQVFQNNTDRQLEATYIFPLPPGATVNDFAMYVNGKRTSGELVEKDKARAVYTQIVRRMKDPGLLEYIGGDLLRMNIFPIPANGTQKLEVEYSEVLRRDSGMHHYVYPLKTEGPASRTLDDFTFSMTIRSKDPITNVYSPTHEFGRTQKNDREVILGFEKDKELLDRDVEVYYAVSDKAFGMNLVTCKPEKDKDGYFMLLITPRYEFAEKDILPRDVCFALDVSGSMRIDKRLAQAKEALKYCVGSLTEKDRFSIVTFANSTDSMATELLPATAENKAKAVAFIDKQEAMGGTAIEAALKLSLGMRPAGEKERPYIVVFLTDGRPTIGNDNVDDLVQMAAPKDGNTRIFTWGVGSDVNTHLLDRIARQTRAVGEYVKPGEKIETKVSLFFNKLSKPVMASPQLDWGKMKVRDVHPAKLPDLFTGQQLAVFGRYEGTGDTAITLSGQVTGREEKQTFEDTLGGDAGNAFVEKLWASRHIGFLLDEIRLHGEKKELKDEVIRLSRTYGIQTPYTSYLILDSEQAYKQHGISRGDYTQKYMPPRSAPDGAVRVTGTRVKEKANVEGMRKEMDRRSRALQDHDDSDAYVRPMDRAAAPSGEARRELENKAKKDLDEVSGDGAVKLSEEIGRLRAGSVAAGPGKDAVSSVQRVGGRTFYLFRGFWVDQDFDAKLPLLKVQYLGDGYFKLLEKFPELKDVFALGERVIFIKGGTAVVIQAEGKESLTDEELKSLE